MQPHAIGTRTNQTSSLRPLRSAKRRGGEDSVPRTFKDYLEQYRLIHSSNRFNLSFTALIGSSEAMNKVRKQIKRAASYDKRVVLVTGESGAGKEVVARQIHEKGARKHAPFVAINCATLDGDLSSDMLFGHMRGAYSGASGDRKGCFEEAHTGTLFLDELAEASPNVQAKLLRILESGVVRRLGAPSSTEVDVRIIAGTNEDVAFLVNNRRFRLDVYFRLAQETIELPPLRDRRSDIAELAAYYLAYFEGVHREHGAKIESVHVNAIGRLSEHEWRGNVRELSIVVENALLNAYAEERNIIREDDINFGPLYSS